VDFGGGTIEALPSERSGTDGVRAIICNANYQCFSSRWSKHLGQLFLRFL